MNPVRMGVVGVGRFGRLHALTLAGLAEARLVALDVATAAGWAPIEPGRVYRVVTNNFLRTGGDGYTMLRDRAIDPYDSGPSLDDVVAAAITASGSFAPRTAGRFLTR